MGNSSYVQTNFLGGEWAKRAQGRVEKPEYRTALNRLLNSVGMAPGSAPRRPGFRHVAPTRNGAPGRVTDFTFQETTPYNMELTEGFLRFFTGATPVGTNDDQVVTAISAANPAEVMTTTAHGWTDDSRVRFLDLEQNNPLLQAREFSILSTGTTTFTLYDNITGDPIDGSALGTFVTGSVRRVLELSSPYSETAIPSVRKVQITQDFTSELILLEGTTIPQVLSVTAEPTGTSFAEFSIAPSNLEDGPYLDPFKNSQVTPSGTTGIIALAFDFKAYDSTVAYSYGDYVTSSSITYRSLSNANQNNTPASSPTYWVVAVGTEFINGGRGILASDIGRHVRINSEPPVWVVGTTYAAGAVVSYQSVAYTSLQASNVGKTPDAQPTWWSITPSAQLWTWGKITAVTGSTVTLIPGSMGSLITSGFSQQAAAFDGVTNQTQAASAQWASGLNIIGKNFSGSPQVIASVTVYAPNNSAFRSVVGTTTTINLYGSMSAPITGTDGTLLGTTGAFVSQAGDVKTIISSDQTTNWNYVWIGPSTIFNAIHSVAEVQFASLVSSGGTGCSVQILGDPLLYVTAARKWRLGLYSDTTGWPRCGVGHEGRVWVSGGAKNRLDASRSFKPFNFAPTETDGSVTASNAFSYTFNAKDANTIRWMHSERQGVLCGTDAGEWMVQATSSSNPLTPTTAQANKATYIKCADAEPIAAEHSTIIIQHLHKKIVEYFADVNNGKFSAPNLNEYASHMLTTNAVELAYQREPTPIIWVRTETGELKGCTYKRESLISSAPADYMGWHRHTLGSGRKVESICVGPSVDLDNDTLAIVSNDTGTSIRHVELLVPFIGEDAEMTDAWFLDNAIEPSSYVVDSVTKTVTLNGLWHLNGQSPTVFAGGLDLGEVAVTNGSATLTIGSVAEFTLPYVQSFGGAMPIVVGFTYTTQGQLVRPVSMADTGAQSGPGFGKQKRNHQMAALLESTAGISFGQSFDAGKLTPFKPTTKGGTPLTKLQLFSGVYTQPVEGDMELDGMLCWQITRPYPATVSMLGGFINTADK